MLKDPGSWWERLPQRREWSAESDPREVKHAKAAKCALTCNKETLKDPEKSSFSDKGAGGSEGRISAGLSDESE